MKIGLFYSPKGGNVNKVADIIYKKLKDDNYNIEEHYVNGMKAEKLLEYDFLIFGNSTLGRHTWSSEQKDEWARILPKVQELDLSDKKIAIFGLGDHVAYGWHFVDAIGDMADAVAKTGIRIVGQVSPDGYKFIESRAFRNGKFAGLPIDEDYEKEKTEERVDRWLDDLKKEFVVESAGNV